MIVHPVASDSLGVRSLSVFVESSVNIFIDPSAALGPKRYGLPPSETEYKTLEKYKEKIRALATKADIFVISHYHYDHYDPNATFYSGKKIFAKHWKEHINYSQRKRAEFFREKIGDTAELICVDNKKIDVNGIEIEFSKPFPHGNEKTKLGFVIMTTIDDGKERVLHASDVEGPIVEEAADYIISQNPDLAIVDGPATYFLGYRFSREDLNRSVTNLKKIADSVPKLILDHHLLRDLKYRERLAEVYEYDNVLSFAEFNGEKINMLEAHRKEF